MHKLFKCSHIIGTKEKKKAYRHLKRAYLRLREEFSTALGEFEAKQHKSKQLKEEIEFLREKLGMFLEYTKYDNSQFLEQDNEELNAYDASQAHPEPGLYNQSSKDFKGIEGFKRNNSVDSRSLSGLSSKKSGLVKQKSHSKAGKVPKKARVIGDNKIQISF